MTRSVRGWERLQPSVSFPPLTWELCCAMAIKATKSGYSAVGAAMLLQFDCLLRLSELVALRREDIVFEGDPRYPREFKGCLLCLRHTKTGRDQSVTVENPDVIRLLHGERGHRASFFYNGRRSPTLDTKKNPAHHFRPRSASLGRFPCARSYLECCFAGVSFVVCSLLFGVLLRSFVLGPGPALRVFACAWCVETPLGPSSFPW